MKHPLIPACYAAIGLPPGEVSRRLTWTALLTAVSVVVGGWHPLPGQAQPTPSLSLSSIIFSAPPPPSDLGEPGGRGEAASRGCGLEDRSTIDTNQTANHPGLTALAPLVSTGAFEVVWGMTTAEQPTFWFYVPPVLMSGMGELVIEADTHQWTYPVELDGSSGIVQITIPESGAALDWETDYHWYFNIYCQPQQPPQFVHGWIRRVALNPALEDELAQATLGQQAELLATEGIWYDALAIAAEVHRTQSDASLWANLLQSVALAPLSHYPLVDCCQVQSALQPIAD